VAAKKRAKAQTPKPAKPRRRRTREEGKQLLLDAAQELLQTATPDEISIREIGALAGVHHRFVAEWFGGKVGLFRVIHDSQTDKISELVKTTRLEEQSGTILESIRNEIVLVVWLITNGSHFEDIAEAFPSVETTKNLFIQLFSLNEEDAEKSAHTIGAIVVADAILRPNLRTKYMPIELIMHQIQLKTPPNK
jgi:AcrR family transcriptional regulator